MDKETLDKEIQRAFQHHQKERLKLDDLCALTGISKGALKHCIFKYYDSWAEACETNGGKCGPTGAENLKRNVGFSKKDCLQEGRRVATLIAPQNLSLTLFIKHVKISTPVICRLWGPKKWWIKFVQELGLPLAEGYRETVPLEVLADDFLKALDLEKKKIPTLMRVMRLSKRGGRCYRKNGYPAFKKAAIEYLLKNRSLDETTCKLLEDELVKISGTPISPAMPPRPHGLGRILGFRQFEYAPTQEQGVVGIFTEVASELGFQISSLREAFPDCLARRKNLKSRRDEWHDCRIEFEWNSRHYKTDEHPLDGCDLIVCWKHDWLDNCPIEVLELESEIKKLPRTRSENRK